MNKQQMIDTVIKENGGKLPVKTDGVVHGVFDDSVYVACVRYGDVICSVSEYQQRARELGYGVEVAEPDSWYCYETQKALRLPPVGTECLVEYDTSANKWFIGKVYFHDGESIVGRWLDGDNAGSLFDYNLSPDLFKPLDHATRKAEAERKRFMKAACDALNTKEINTDIDASFTLRLAIDALYDAGFRMPEGK